MAAVVTCDGTGDVIAPDTPTTGMFGKQYSDEARPVAEAYLQAVNDLHTKHAAAFQAELDELRAKTRLQLMQLPDDPT